MPILIRFYGLIVKIYFQQAELDFPYVVAIYNEFSGAIDIKKLEMIDGNLPKKALELATEWIQINQSDLLKICAKQEVKRLEPLV
ncbi:MAG: DUF4160 domain-containing protein [Oscillospiraceae bacterium]